MATQKPIISIVLDEETLKRVEDFQFHNRISSRSKAVGQLIIMGLMEWETSVEDMEGIDVSKIDYDKEFDQLMNMLNEIRGKMKRRT